MEWGHRWYGNKDMNGEDMRIWNGDTSGMGMRIWNGEDMRIWNGDRSGMRMRI